VRENPYSLYPSPSPLSPLPLEGVKVSPMSIGALVYGGALHLPSPLGGRG